MSNNQKRKTGLKWTAHWFPFYKCQSKNSQRSKSNKVYIKSLLWHKINVYGIWLFSSRRMQSDTGRAFWCEGFVTFSVVICFFLFFFQNNEATPECHRLLRTNQRQEEIYKHLFLWGLMWLYHPSMRRTLQRLPVPQQQPHTGVTDTAAVSKTTGLESSNSWRPTNSLTPPHTPNHTNPRFSTITQAVSSSSFTLWEWFTWQWKNTYDTTLMWQMQIFWPYTVTKHKINVWWVF